MKKYNGNEKKRIDALFAQKLRQHTHTPAPDSWARVQAQVGSKPRRKGFLWWLLPLALLLAAGGAGVWYAGSQQNPTSAETVPETHTTATTRKTQEKATAETPVSKEKVPAAHEQENETLPPEPVTKQNEKPRPEEVKATPKAQTVENPRTGSTTDSLTAAPVLRLPTPDSLSTAEVPTTAPPQPDTLQATESYTEIEVEFHLGSAPGSRAEEQQDTQRVPSKAERVLRNLWHLKQGDGKADLNELLPNKKSKKK